MLCENVRFVIALNVSRGLNSTQFWSNKAMMVLEKQTRVLRILFSCRLAEIFKRFTKQRSKHALLMRSEPGHKIRLVSRLQKGNKEEYTGSSCSFKLTFLQSKITLIFICFEHN